MESIIKPIIVNNTHVLKTNIHRLQEYLIQVESIEIDDKCTLLYDIIKKINIEIFKINITLNNKKPNNENTIDLHIYNNLLKDNNIHNTYIFKILLDKISSIYVNDYTDTFNDIINIFTKFKIQKEETNKNSSLNLILLTLMRNKFMNENIDFDPIYDIDDMDVEYIKVMQSIIEQYYNYKKKEEHNSFLTFKYEIIYYTFELIKYLQVNEKIINKIVNEWSDVGNQNNISSMY